MRKRIAWLPILMLLMSCGLPKQKEKEIKLLTYNIKNDYQKEGSDTWDLRKQRMFNLLHHYEPGIFGVQEALLNQLVYLDSCLTQYRYIGTGRDGEQAGEYCAIFYDTTQYKVIKQSTFWLSPTPEVVSKGWDAAYPRICTFAQFQVRDTPERFWVFNTHLDHVGIIARLESAKQLLQQIQTLNVNYDPVILMGDFNAQEDESSIQYLKTHLKDGLYISQSPCYGPLGTFNGFASDPVDRRIDYFFIQNMKVRSYVHIDDRRDNNRHISDHFPVMMTIAIE